MALLQPDDEKALRERFQRDLKDDVQIILFTQALNCPTCPDAEAIAREVAELSDKIELVMKNPTIDKDDTDGIKTDLLPAWRIQSGDTSPNLVFYGLPAGYEFSAFVETLVSISRKEPLIDGSVVEKAKNVTRPFDIKVFVTPTCPYCPQMAFLAFQLAQVNPKITASVIEASEFPTFVSQYQVRAVPRTVINDQYFFDGAIPPEAFIDQLIELQKQEPKNGNEEGPSSASGGGLIIVP